MALITTRFAHEMPTTDVYAELKHHIDNAKNEELKVKPSEVTLDLANSNIIVGDKVFSLSARAEDMLCDRIGIGKIHNILKTGTYQAIEPEIQAYMVNQLEGELTLKHRGSIIQAVVSDRFREIPYEMSVGVLEELGARPIRLSMNDALMTVQAIFDKADRYTVEPKDGEALQLGVQMRTSDVGASSNHFELFAYRFICSNGVIFGKNTMFKFRVIHAKSRYESVSATDAEIKRVLGMAQAELTRRIDSLIGQKIDRAKVVDFLAKQPAIGKKALAMLAERIVVAKTMYDVVNILTEEGHNPDNSASLQNTFEVAAGELMMLAA